MTNWKAEGTGSPFEGLDRNGIVFTEDGGYTFKRRLIDRRISAITFKDGYVFAGGDDGLFISSDGGDSWIQSPQIRSANTFLKIQQDLMGLPLVQIEYGLVPQMD